MFIKCSSLLAAPALPAAELKEYCYQSMFEQCSSLVTAPELPASYLAYECYAQMFKDCTSLNYVKAMFTSWWSSSAVSDWLSGVSETGTYVMNEAATYTPAEAGVPAGWTVERATE